LKLDENRIYCPHFSINEKVCNREIILSEVSENVKDAYPDGKCPDCGEPIPDNIIGGDKCSNCGHIFHRLENIKGIKEMRDEGYMQREQGWKKGMGL
jgi:Zn finger protein HypA/HybF involved in hydrogenase expression